MAIKSVKVWSKVQADGRKEYRIYVHSTDGQEGCLYLTGNKWNAKNSTDGNLTAADWEIAKQACGFAGNSKWHTWYATENSPVVVKAAAQPTTSTVKTNRLSDYCDYCGKYLAPGEGSIDRLTDEEDIDRHNGKAWSVGCCLDFDGCKSRQDTIKAERIVKFAQETQARTAVQARYEAMTKSEREVAFATFIEALQDMPDPR